MHTIKKHLSVLILLFLLSHGVNAQFGSLINKAKNKALEKLTGKKATDSSAVKKDTTASPAATPDATTPAAADPSNGSNNSAASHNPPPVKPIDFPHTGVNVKAIHV